MKGFKLLHGSLNLDSMYFQMIGRQRLWLTDVQDWTSLDDDQKK